MASDATTTAVDTDDEPVPITIGNATVQDAFVDFNLANASPGELKVILDEPLDRAETFFPVVEEDPDADVWLAEGDGLFEQYQSSPAHPPADESPKTSTVEVEHEDGITEDRVVSFEHETVKAQNRRDPYSAFQVQFTGDGMYLTTYPVRVELAHEIVERYINGPLGTETTSDCWYTREVTNRYTWNQLQTWAGRDDYEPYAEADVELVADDTFTWAVKRADHVEAGDVVFEPNTSYPVVVWDEYGTSRDIYDSWSDARDRRDDLGDDEYSLEQVRFDSYWSVVEDKAQCDYCGAVFDPDEDGDSIGPDDNAGGHNAGCASCVTKQRERLTNEAAQDQPWLQEN